MISVELLHFKTDLVLILKIPLTLSPHLSAI